MNGDMVFCPFCGQSYQAINELRECRGLGLALLGLCECGRWFGVNRLWRPKCTELDHSDEGEAGDGKPSVESGNLNEASENAVSLGICETREIRYLEVLQCQL